MHFIAIETQPQIRQQSSMQSRHYSRSAATTRTTADNPFAYRSTPSTSASVCLGEHDSSSSTIGGGTTGATYVAKILTFVLLGFAAGLFYHMSQLGGDFQSMSHHHTNHRHLQQQQQEQMLQANDHIVQQLASENQHHQEELARLKQQLEDQQERQEAIDDETEQQQHNNLRTTSHHHGVAMELLLQNQQEDKHALLWTNKVHDARLDAAHEQAEALLRARHQM